MPYYNTIEEDLKRAKEILAEGRLTERDLAGLPPLMRETLSETGGTIFGKDTYAAYKLLESFVEIIEAMDPKVIKTVMRAQQISRRTDALVSLVLDTQECVCRTRSCGHKASEHHNGVCEVCNAGNCWC